MRCPSCQSRTVVKHGVSGWGKAQYLCAACRHQFSRSGLLAGVKGWAGCIVLGVAVLPLLLNGVMFGLLRFLPTHQAEPVDAIVILGRGPQFQGDRALAASRLWHEQQAPYIFVSGMTDAPQIIQLLQEMGVPRSNMGGERCSQSTWENGLFSDILLSERQIERILLITDRPHRVRSHLVFESFGFEVVTYSGTLEPESVFSVQPYQQSLREFVGLVAYGITGKLKPLSPERRRQAEAIALHKIEDWGCNLSRPD